MMKTNYSGIASALLVTALLLTGCGGGGGGGSSTSTPSNAIPVANAGIIQNVVTTTLVTLDGSTSSDANGDPLTYSWTLTSKPAGSTATLTGATSAAPTFTADVAGTYVASLVVNDGKVNSAAATVTITAAVANVAPVANAGVAQNVITGTLVTLNGSASSDANGDSLTYSWTLTSKPAGSTATLTGATSAAPTFTADVAGTYVASLVVNDGQVNSTAVTVTITSAPPHLDLQENTGILTTNYTSVAFPYSSSGVVTASVTGIPAPTTYTIDQFKITAVGGTFTIQGLSAVDSNGFVSPYFSGLANGQIITDGASVSFSLISPLTGGKTANINYVFSILENGNTFNCSVQLTTN